MLKLVIQEYLFPFVLMNLRFQHLIGILETLKQVQGDEHLLNYLDRVLLSNDLSPQVIRKWKYKPFKTKAMNIISSKAHGVIDYIYGIFLIISPWLFGFARGGPESWIMIIIGGMVVLMSLFTDYETGLVKAIPLNVHLWVDGLAGVVLMLSPWIFGFRDFVMWPHVILGIVEIGTAMMTESRTHTRTV
jgi:hypothetical protein